MSQYKISRTIILIIGLLFLTACGNKGDLYRPEPVPPKTEKTSLDTSLKVQ